MTVRRTGKTTKMLFDAAAVVINGEGNKTYTVVAWSLDYAMSLRQKLMDILHMGAGVSFTKKLEGFTFERLDGSRVTLSVLPYDVYLKKLDANTFKSGDHRFFLDHFVGRSF